MTLRCLWIRRRIGPYLDQALAEDPTRAVARHLNGCADCRELAGRQQRLMSRVGELAGDPTEPKWNAFWPGVRARILSEAPLAGRPPWRSPLLWPLGSLPRVAVGSAMAGVVLFLGLVFWENHYPVAPPEPGVVVGTLETASPNASVMVFSTPEQEMTVIWVFGLDPSGDQSRRQPEDTRWTWHPPSLAFSSA